VDVIPFRIILIIFLLAFLDIDVCKNIVIVLPMVNIVPVYADVTDVKTRIQHPTAFQL
jgi:hypothetical protein